MSYIVPEIKQWLPNASAPVRVATTLEVVNGNGQSARVDQRLANPLVVRVKDQNGAAMSGVSVSFSVTPGGTVSPSSATTGSNGEAETRLTLGGPPGTYTVTARASGITQSVTFTATATAPAPLAFSPNTIAAQTFTVGSAIQPLRLPIATGGTAPYTYSLSPIPAGLLFSSADRLLSGTPTTAATATSITYTVRDASGRSASLTFTITVAARPAAPVPPAPPVPSPVATTLEVGSGNGQSARVNQRLANPLVVRVKNQNNAAMSGVSVSFSVTPSGTVSPSSATTGSNGEAETRLTLGGTPGTYTVTARASGITQSVTFTATATAAPQEPAPLAFSPNTIADQTFTVGSAIQPLRLPIATGGTAPYTYSLSPIPAGLSFSSAERLLSGTPTTAATATSITYTVRDASGRSASLTFTITVAARPAANITFRPSAIAAQTFTVGSTIQPLRLPVATGGTAPYTYSLSPIPAGLSFSSAERLLSGTPVTAATATSISYTVRDASGRSASLTFTITVAAPPDLVVGAPQASKVNLQPGESFSLEVSVRNQGAVTAPATTLRFYQSADNTITSADVELSTIPISALAPNGFRKSSIARVAPTSPGTYYYGACVDPVGDEGRIDNNCSTAVTITVGGKPRFNPNAIDDQTFVVNTPIEPLSLPIATGGTAPYTYSLSPIPAGLSFSSTERLLSGTPTTAATATSLSYTARDASGRSASLTFTITVTAHPDLVVESPEISSSDLQPGESFRLEVSVRNQGAVTAPATTLRFYQSADSTVTASDVEVGTTAVGSLTSGGSSGTSITLTAPVTPGTYYYGACVDAVGNERRTDNNCSTVVTITVRDPLDVNRDGQVDVLDLVRVAFLYGTRGTGLPEDVNTDGVVDLSDLTAVTRGIDAAGGINGLSLIELEAALLAVIEQMEAIEGLGKAPMRLTHVRVSYIAYANVAAALNDVKHLAIGDTRAVLSAFLRLLAEIVLIPKTTKLLPNYPNPFNPETWIPYQLAKAADVTLYIYAVDGPLVRTLALGHQAAGVHQSRSRAAYWDGRNQLGEPVASGLYFYTLTAGDFTATRKMFIRK